MVKFPEVEVKLTGEDGNAFSIIGIVSRELRNAGVSEDEILNYTKEAMSGSYDKLLQVTMDWVHVC